MKPKCIGFGDKEGKCNNPAGTKWSPHWCEECNRKRLDHITNRLEEMNAKFSTPTHKAEGR